MIEKIFRFREGINVNPEVQDPEIALEILRAVNKIRYGSVEIVVHDGRVVQIERKEKIRFERGLAAKTR